VGYRADSAAGRKSREGPRVTYVADQPWRPPTAQKKTKKVRRPEQTHLRPAKPAQQ